MPATQDQGQLHVKNTFLHFAGEVNDVGQQRFDGTGLRVRASSDPQLFDRGDQASGCESSSNSDQFGIKEARDEGCGPDFVLRGLSDDEGTDVEPPPAPLDCYSHITQDDEELDARTPRDIEDLPRTRESSPVYHAFESGCVKSEKPMFKLAAEQRKQKKKVNKKLRTPSSQMVVEPVERAELALKLQQSEIFNRRVEMPRTQQPVPVSLSSALIVGGDGAAPQSRTSKSSAQGAYERLASENARLAAENRQLVQHCLNATAAACSMARESITAAAAVAHLSRAPTPGNMLAVASKPHTDGTASKSSSLNPAPVPAGANGQLVCFNVPGGVAGGVPWVMCNPGVAAEKRPQQGLQLRAQLQPCPQQQEPQQMQQLRPQQFSRQQQTTTTIRNPPRHAQLHRDLEAAPATLNSVASLLTEVTADSSCESDDENIRLRGSSGAAAPVIIPNNARTTVMLRNLPNNYTRAMLLAMINSEGFSKQYDFVYLPIDFGTRACLGYAFVNLHNHELAIRFWRAFDNYSKWIIPSKKHCGVCWSHPQQGLEANIQRYRNSPVMHESVPDEYKPQIYTNGVISPFPPPTKKLRVPRIRGLKKPDWA